MGMSHFMHISITHVDEIVGKSLFYIRVLIFRCGDRVNKANNKQHIELINTILIYYLFLTYVIVWNTSSDYGIGLINAS